MRVFKRGLPLWLAMGVLAGCASGGKDEPVAPANAPAVAAPTVANDGRCHAEGAQYTLGQMGSETLLEQARQRSGASVARVLRPDDMITMDYRSDRLNLYLDGNAKVSRANCG